MYCTSCRSMLRAGEQTCSRCGAPAPNPYVGGSASGPQYPPVATPVQQNPYSTVPPPPLQNPYSVPQPPPDPYSAPQPPQSLYSAHQGVPQAYYNNTIPIMPGEQGQMRPPRRRGSFVVMALVLIFILLGSLGFVYYATIYQPDVMRVQATATAGARANATAHAQATAAAANPYTSAGILSITDPLKDNSRGHQWDVNNNCFFKNGAYHANAPNAAFGDYCIAQATELADFTFEVQMNIIKGDGGGINFRSNNNGGTNGYYDFYVFQDGSYGLSMENSTSTILRSGSSVAVHQGLNQTNLLAVVVKGTTIQLYINHQPVTRVNDSTYGSGRIGVEADPLATGGHQTEVVYRNAKVWTS